MNYLAYGSGQHYGSVAVDDSMPSASTINMSDMGDYINMGMNDDISSPQYSSYQENSNSNPSPPSGGEGQHYHHAPYAVTVPRYDEKTSKKGYIINANKKLQLTHGPPKYTKKRGPFEGGSGGPSPSAHDKAIIGKYRKEMRKEEMHNPHSQSHGSLPRFQPQEHHQQQFSMGLNRRDEFHVHRPPVPSGAGDPGLAHPPPQRKPKAKKQSQFQQAKSELQKRLQEKGDIAKKKKLQKVEVEQAKMNRKQKRIERNKVQTQMTPKGQPLMKGRILNLLSKIEEQQQHNV